MYSEEELQAIYFGCETAVKASLRKSNQDMDQAAFEQLFTTVYSDGWFKFKASVNTGRSKQTMCGYAWVIVRNLFLEELTPSNPYQKPHHEIEKFEKFHQDNHGEANSVSEGIEVFLYQELKQIGIGNIVDDAAKVKRLYKETLPLIRRKYWLVIEKFRNDDPESSPKTDSFFYSDSQLYDSTTEINKIKQWMKAKAKQVL